MEGPLPETLGQYLKRERESRSVALEELSRATRINLPFLEALEKDDFQFFSQPQFILGFLRGYARHLGIDPKEVLGRYRFQAELAKRKETFRQLPLFPSPTPPEEKIAEPQPLPQRTPLARVKGRSRRNLWIQVAIVAVAVILSFYLHHLLKKKDFASLPSSGEFRRGTDPQNTRRSPETQERMDPVPAFQETDLPKGSPGKNPEVSKTEAGENSPGERKSSPKK